MARYPAHKNLPVDLILNQMNTVRMLTYYVLSTHLNIIFPSMTRSAKVAVRFSDYIILCIFSMRVMCYTYLILFS
jgi:hypothetical protein